MRSYKLLCATRISICCWHYFPRSAVCPRVPIYKPNWGPNHHGHLHSVLLFSSALFTLTSILWYFFLMVSSHSARFNSFKIPFFTLLSSHYPFSLKILFKKNNGLYIFLLNFLIFSIAPDIPYYIGFRCTVWWLDTCNLPSASSRESGITWFHT